MPKISKKRLDLQLVERGFADNRSRARNLVAFGLVSSGGCILNKPGQALAEDVSIEVRKAGFEWVGRGGFKLAHGLKFFNIGAVGTIAIDIGASTGGFTDVLLAGGARRVYAVDVGQGQLVSKLRQDERVVVLENTNARYLSVNEVPEPIDLVVCDVSFIGLRVVLPAALQFADSGAHLIALIKPQFEVGRANVGKGGIVHDAKIRDEICNTIKDWLNGFCGWRVLGITESPITGRHGNIEFLIGAVKYE